MRRPYIGQAVVTPKRRRRQMTACPQCAGEFPAGRLACPHCGSDAQTGWSEGGDDYAFTDEDYDEAVAGIQGHDDLASPKWRRRKLLVRVTGIVVVVALLALIFGVIGRL